MSLPKVTRDIDERVSRKVIKDFRITSSEESCKYLERFYKDLQENNATLLEAMERFSKASGLEGGVTFTGMLLMYALLAEQDKEDEIALLDRSFHDDPPDTLKNTG